MYSDDELEYLLGNAPQSEDNLEEDLLIQQPDGSRACLNWELRGKGYHLVNEFNEKYYELSGKELLDDAYLKLKERNDI
jgi:hypothetical protein